MSSATRDSELLPRHRGAWLLLGWLLLGTVAVGSLVPSLPQAATGMSDKLMHFAAYAAVAFSFAGVFERRRWGHVAVGLLLFGGAIELAQEHLTASRSGEWRDFAANGLGIGAGLMSAALFPKSWCRHVEIAAGLGRAGR